MLKDITIGQYYPINSFIHQIDPRTKIIFTLVFMMSLVISNSLFSFILLVIITFLIMLATKIPARFIIRGLKPLTLILVITFAIHLFTTPGTTVTSVGFLTITQEGFKKALLMSVRLVVLILTASVLTLTTTPIALTDGMEKLLAPLRKLGFSPHELAMMMSIAIRFIPTLIEETDKIIKAQAARGADFQEGNLLQRARNLLPILVPLFVSAFKRANELAMAMEARCYQGGENRTKMKQLTYTRLDYTTYLLATFILTLTVILRFEMF